MRALLASPLGFLIGLSLGSLGGGGSILAVPALVYGAGEPAQAATTTSLLVVGVAALMGMGSHWRAGRVRLGAGLLFGGVGIGGSLVGTALNRQVDPDLLLLAFSGVMVIAGAAMWRRQAAACPAAPAAGPVLAAPLPAGPVAAAPGPGEGPVPGSEAVGVVALVAPPVAADVAAPARPRLDARTTVRVVAAGSVVGLLTGFFGVGGGFVIVPALVLTLGFAMPEAVGTSLVVIALNAATALVLRAGSADIRWGDALPFLVLAVLGTLVGRRVADRVSPAVLTRGFVVLLLAVAAYTAVTSAAAVV